MPPSSAIATNGAPATPTESARRVRRLRRIPEKLGSSKASWAWGETSAWVGPPGSLKSALKADLTVAVAFNRGWHSKKTKGTGIAVVYFALERADARSASP